MTAEEVRQRHVPPLQHEWDHRFYRQYVPMSELADRAGSEAAQGINYTPGAPTQVSRVDRCLEAPLTPHPPDKVSFETHREGTRTYFYDKNTDLAPHQDKVLQGGYHTNGELGHTRGWVGGGADDDFG